MRAKLVRDRIVSRTGDLYHQLKSPAARHLALVAKLHEEVEEINRDPTSVEEYADVITALQSLAELHGVSRLDILKKELEKTERLGAFDAGRLLEAE